MDRQTVKRAVLFLLFFTFLFSATASDVWAQGVTAGKASSPPARAVPGPAQPTTAGKGGAQPAFPKGNPANLEKGRNAKDRLRAKEKRNEETDYRNPPPPPPTVASPWNLRFESLDQGDLRIISTSWETVARGGERPFTVVKVKVANLSGSFVAVQGLRLHGVSAVPLDPSDPRSIPPFPISLNRFLAVNRLVSPIAPHARQTLTFAFPFAWKNTRGLKTEVTRYVKFSTQDKVNWNPVRVVGWETSRTTTGGKSHQGMLLCLENEGDHAVKARMRFSLDGLTAAGGKTRFFAPVSLQAGERRTVLFRSIPDEGLPAGSPKRDTYPSDFKVRDVEVVDLQF